MKRKIFSVTGFIYLIWLAANISFSTQLLQKTQLDRLERKVETHIEGNFRELSGIEARLAVLENQVAGNTKILLGVGAGVGLQILALFFNTYGLKRRQERE